MDYHDSVARPSASTRNRASLMIYGLLDSAADTIGFYEEPGKPADSWITGLA